MLDLIPMMYSDGAVAAVVIAGHVHDMWQLSRSEEVADPARGWYGPSYELLAAWYVDDLLVVKTRPWFQVTPRGIEPLGIEPVLVPVAMPMWVEDHGAWRWIVPYLVDGTRGTATIEAEWRGVFVKPDRTPVLIRSRGP